MASQLASQNPRVGGLISILVILMIGTSLANLLVGDSQALVPKCGK